MDITIHPTMTLRICATTVWDRTIMVSAVHGLQWSFIVNVLRHGAIVSIGVVG